MDPAAGGVGLSHARLHFLPSIADEASGPSYSVPALCGELHDLGIEVELHVTGMRADQSFLFPVTCHPTRPGSKMCISSGLRETLKEERTADVFTPTVFGP